MHRLLRRAALPVHGDAGHRLGKAGREPGRARDVARLRADRVHAAEHHVIHLRRIDLGAGEQGRDRMRPEIGGMRGGEAAAATADGGTHRVDDVRARHGLCHRRLPVYISRTRSSLAAVLGEGESMRIAYTPEQERIRLELRDYFGRLMTDEVRAALAGTAEG